MSDFLSRLAGRAMGVEPVVLPVIAAMNAPVSREEGFRESEGFEEAVHDRQWQQATEAPQVLSKPAQIQTEALPFQQMQERETASTIYVHSVRSADQITVSESLAGKLDKADGVDPTIPSSPAPSYLQPAATASKVMTQDWREGPSSAPPIVRVSIGRIEVRAELPSPRERTPATPRPNSAISLDDYLKQRTEGRR